MVGHFKKKVQEPKTSKEMSAPPQKPTKTVPSQSPAAARDPEAIKTRVTPELLQRLDQGLKQHLPPMRGNFKDDAQLPEQIAQFYGQWDPVNLYYEDFLQLVGALGLPPLPPQQQQQLQQMNNKQ